MNFLKTTALFFFSFISFNLFAQLELDKDANNLVTYEVEGDSVKIYVEILNDFSLELDDDGALSDGDDYVYLMFDLNANGVIDLGASQIDLMLTYDSTQSNNICASKITAPNSTTACLSTGARATVQLMSTTAQATAHTVYSFTVPKNELDFGSSSALCGRISVKIHRGGTTSSDDVTFPAQSGSDDYFVSPYNSIKLYPEAQILLPNGELAPSATVIPVCVGDTLRVYDGYPSNFWSGLSEDYFQTVLNIPTEIYAFKIVDPNDANCVISDTVNIQMLDESLCTGAYKFPNVVTPNDDGVNDIFQLMIGQDLLNQDWTGAKLKVYNRWGAKVYQSQDNAYPYWDLRKENGDRVVAGTYYYTFTTPGDNPQVINGFFAVFHDE